MEDKILNHILNNTYTFNDLQHRLRVIKAKLTSQFFNSPFKNEDFQKVDIDWLESLDQIFLQLFTKENFNLIFENIEERLKTIDLLTVYLAFEMGGIEIQRFGQFIRLKTRKNLLIEIKYDPNLIAGCALVWQGIYKDFSLKNTLKQQQSEIIAGFKTFTGKMTH